jgi:hypothetical protein
MSELNLRDLKRRKRRRRRNRRRRRRSRIRIIRRRNMASQVATFGV